MPHDYYLDLAAQFDLTQEYLDRLEARNLLYDEDADGAYLQFYSRPYMDGFFFEIVERQGAYDGYGARNAPYRTAALKHVLRA